jgi:hypothetical protein
MATTERAFVCGGNKYYIVERGGRIFVQKTSLIEVQFD